MKKKCEINKCPDYKECKDTLTSWLFFITAIIATIATRAVGPLADVKPAYGKLAWYMGILGFFIFFLYKYIMDHKRYLLITKQDLVMKVRENRKLEKNDYALLNAIMCGLISNKDKINFFFIAAFSIIALLITFISIFLGKVNLYK